jgi:ribonuclease P protein component
VGGAVERNHVKRLLREAFELEAQRLPAGHDVVIVARPEARVVAERDGLEGIRIALAELIDQLRARVEGERTR